MTETSPLFARFSPRLEGVVKMVEEKQIQSPNVFGKSKADIRNGFLTDMTTMVGNFQNYLALLQESAPTEVAQNLETLRALYDRFSNGLTSWLLEIKAIKKGQTWEDFLNQHLQTQGKITEGQTWVDYGQSQQGKELEDIRETGLKKADDLAQWPKALLTMRNILQGTEVR